MKLMIAGGGTGGHLYSGIAVAEEWVARGFDVVFVGTSGGIEKDLVPRHGFRLATIPVSKLKGGTLGSRLRTLAGLPRALWRSRALLKREKPAAVLGIGGYASGPVVLVASWSRLKTAVLDQNSVPGLTNRILGRWAGRVFLNFEVARSFFDEKKVRVTGNPVIRSRRVTGRPLPRQGKTLLVCGGSQGAHPLNEKMKEAYPALFEKFPGLRVIHQTGNADFEGIKQFIGKKGYPVEASPFIHDIEKIYGESDLVVSRAGAGTLTELAAMGLPSLLVPYPYAADDHQRMNAEVFVRAGAAEMILQKDLTPEKLTGRLTALLEDQEKREAMSRNALKLARPDAAKDIVDELLKLGSKCLRV